MKKTIGVFMLGAVFTIFFFTGCSSTEDGKLLPTLSNTKEQKNKKTEVVSTEQEVELEKGFSAVKYEGDYGFDQFLEQGGASSDDQIIDFLSRNMLEKIADLSLQSKAFGCSSLSVRSPEGTPLFGRNFDWQHCDALVVTAKPDNGYASVSTVNLDFLNSYDNVLEQFPAKARTLVSLYAPLDGMNEKGLCVAVLMITDSDIIDQNTGGPDITTTTAIRMMLDKAANVEEALSLLGEYDMHSSLGLMVHFALADREGNSVVVEYVNNEMVVTETPVVTNFYLAEGDKYGIGTEQSHTRYEILIEQLKKTPQMDINGVRDALRSVSKNNFGEFESTEWSIVYNQNDGEIYYYRRENFGHAYIFRLDFL